jgi:hypothetical protein
MTAQIGDEVMIMSPERQEPVREGEIRGVSDDGGGVVYLVQWSDTGQESLLRPGPDVVINHRRGRGSGSEAVAAGAAPWLSRLRHPLQWRRSRDLEQSQQTIDQQLAWRVQDIIAGLGLIHSDFSIGGGRIVHHPEVVSVAAGPPVGLDIRILPGQTPDDFAAHAPAIAYDLGVAEVRVVPLGPYLIRLELLPHDSQSEHPSASR